MERGLELLGVYLPGCCLQVAVSTASLRVANNRLWQELKQWEHWEPAGREHWERLNEPRCDGEAVRWCLLALGIASDTCRRARRL